MTFHDCHELVELVFPNNKSKMFGPAFCLIILAIHFLSKKVTEFDLLVDKAKRLILSNKIKLLINPGYRRHFW